MKNEPLISIVVPVFKVEKYLDRCLESIVNQTYKNLEILVVDDGSPDSSPAICDKWAAADERIRVIHKKNEGVGIARNTALDTANGEYIGFVDGDDYCFANMYSVLYKNLTENDADISMCSYYEDDVEIDSVPEHTVSVEVKAASEYMPDLCTAQYGLGLLWNKLYKKETVAGLHMPPLVCSQDLPYNYEAFKRAQKVVFSTQQLYFYRNRKTSTTKTTFKAGAFDAIKSRKIILDGEKDNPELLPYAIKGYVSSNLVVLSGVIKNNMFTERIDELRNEVLKYKKQVLFSDIYGTYDKIKVFVLWLSLPMFKKLIKRGK